MNGDRFSDLGWKQPRGLARSAAIVIGALVAAIAVPSIAAEAAPALACGATVTTNVTLGADLLNCPVDGLVVGATGITINLNGHKITGTSGAGPFDPVLCLCGVNDRAGYGRVTLRGGLIEGFVEGAQFSGAQDVTVNDLMSRGHYDDGIFFDHVVGASVRNSKLLNSFRGVEADYSRRVVVSDASAVDIQHAGFAFFSTAQSVVRDSTANMGLGDYGVEIVNSSHNLVTHNQIRRWGSDGIVVVDLPEWDSLPTTANAFVENDLGNGLDIGIELVEVDGGTVRDNVVSGNVIRAVTVTAGANPAFGYGILVDALRSLNHDGFPPFEYLVGVGPSGNRIKENTASGNDLDGIRLNAPGNVVTDNIANRNGDWGIFAVSGNADGGGNRARDNGQAAQCRGVSCTA